MKVPTTPINSKRLKAVHSKDTKIEVKLRKALWNSGIRYRKNVKVLNCHPDIVIKKYKLAIFCDGDFWHGKEFDESQFTNNKAYWCDKIKRNKERDLENTITLRDAGWTVLRFWEQEINEEIDKCVAITTNSIEMLKTRRLQK